MTWISSPSMSLPRPAVDREMAYTRQFVTLAAALLFACGCGEPSDTREFSLAHFLPAHHALTEGMFSPLSQELESLSGGRLSIRQYPAGALNSSSTAQYSILLKGVADIALIIPTYTADLFPKTDLIIYPGICKTAMECTEALQRARAVLDAEYDAKVLALWATAAPVLLTRDVPVRKLEDMRGLKIRVMARSAIPIIEALGASAIMQPGTVVHQNLTTGVIDGVAISPTGIAAYQLHEPAAFLTTWLPLSGLPFALLMNQGVYDSLSPEERGWINDAADQSLSIAGAESFTRATDEGMRLAVEAGVEIIDLSESEKRRFEEAVATVLESGVAQQVDGMPVAELLRLFSVGSE